MGRVTAPARTAAAVAYMHEHYAEEVTVDDLARATHLSYFHFCRAFRAEHGTSPMRYLRTVRMAAAAELLVSTDETVENILESVGWRSVGTASTTFTALYGCPPRDYRANHRGAS